ncbi:MAG: hypothetical protein HYU66_00830 [Armatimonadetes bacterium]|nr:hypothetical protein [Armatimonadota bacterium]
MRRVLWWGVVGLALLAMAGSRMVLSTAKAGTGAVTWEAEDPKATLDSPFRKVNGTKLDSAPRPQRNAGGGYADIPEKVNGDKHENLPGWLRFKVKVPAAGQYYLWARVYWTDGCGNSFWVRKAGRNRQLLGEDGTYKTWHWVKLADPRLPLAAGENTIEFLNREDGAFLDQVQITTAGRVPTGVQPVTPGALVN